MLRERKLILFVCLALVVALCVPMSAFAQYDDYDDDDDDDGDDRGGSAEAMNRLVWLIWRLTGPENWTDVRLLETTDEGAEETGQRGDYF